MIKLTITTEIDITNNYLVIEDDKKYYVQSCRDNYAGAHFETTGDKVKEFLERIKSNKSQYDIQIYKR